MKTVISSIVFVLVCLPTISFADTNAPALFRARVQSIESERVEPTELLSDIVVQDVKARIMSGSLKDKIVSVSVESMDLEKGDRIIIEQLEGEEGEVWQFFDFNRRAPLLVTVGIFLLAIILLAGWQGLRSIVSLAVSISVVLFVMVPLLSKGYSPVLVGGGLSLIVLASAILITHGMRRGSLIALLGTTITVICTMLLSFVLVKASSITGYATHEAVYLNFGLGKGINMMWLFLTGLMISMLGVLDDISVTQVAVVEELFHASPEATRMHVFRRALRVGREHVGALVNTLVLAYVGVSLPTLLYFHSSTLSIGALANQELFASEILRACLGSLGLIMTVPLTTLLAVLILPRHGHPTLEHSHHGHSH